MADEHPLENFAVSDTRYGERREVTFDNGILIVETRSESDTSIRHYRLVEVEMQWVEVKP